MGSTMALTNVQMKAPEGGVKSECDGQLASSVWPPRPSEFPRLMTPVEAAQYLRLDELNHHSPKTAIRTLNYWRDQGHLRATKFARRVWYLKAELDKFLRVKTES